jgi:4-amino-4-deoxy-L-arabinose transferase-like glycosyltransferase
MDNIQWLDYESVMFFGIKKKILLKYFPVLLVLLNLFLKIIFISKNPIGGDEPFSIYHAQMNVSSIIDLMKFENNPPLHFLILHFWIKLFGISAFSVRFLSVIFSSITAIVIYQIGCKFFTFRIGFIGSVLFSFSNLNLLLAHEARVYALFGLLTALSMYYFLSIRNKKNKYLFLFLLLIVNALLVYAHYFGFFVIFIQTLAVLLIIEIRKPISKFYLIYLLLLICLYIPNILVFWHRFSISSHGTWVVKPNGIVSIYDMLWDFSNQPVTTVFCISLLLVACVKLIFKWNQSDKSTNTIIVLIWFILPFFFMFAISYLIPMFIGRYLIFVTPAYYLTLALSITFLFRNKKYQNVLFAIFILLFLTTFNPNKGNKSHATEIVNQVKALKDKNTSVIICHSYFMLNFAYYYSKDIFCEVDNGNQYKKLTKMLNDDLIFPVNSAEYIQYNQKRIIFVDVDANGAFPDNNIYNSLCQRYKMKNKIAYYDNLNVYVFEQ